MMSTHSIFEDKMDVTFKEKSGTIASMIKKTPKSFNDDDYNAEGAQLGRRRAHAVM